MSNWGDETVPAGGATQPGVPEAEPTVAATQVGGPPGGPGGPDDFDGGDNGDFEEENERRRVWMIIAGVLLVGLLIGALIAILASGGDDDGGESTTTTSSSTTTSTTTTSTSTTTTSTTTTTTTPPTTAAPGPQITQFVVNQSTQPDCPDGDSIDLKWTTVNTQDVTLGIDSPNPFSNYPSNSQQTVPFACGGQGSATHTYYLTANGNNGQKVTQSIQVQSVPST